MNGSHLRFARIAVPVPLTPIDLLPDYRIPEALLGQIIPGSLVSLKFGRQELWGIVFELVDKPKIDESKVKELTGLMLSVPVFDIARLNFLLWLSKHYFYPIGEVCEAALPGSVRGGTERTLKLPEPEKKVPVSSEGIKQLNSAQKAAVDTLSSLKTGTQLLWGVTGSGKTEVYLQAIGERIARDEGALVLVPEISLTPQLTERFERRFPGQVAIFHSGQKPAQLRKAWLSALVGNKRIAIGARSAIFAPVQKMGIVIVDEEHDGSYKQDDRLRYNARDGAIVLAGLCKVPVILGSATPSSETLHGVAQGRVGCSKLPDRATEAAQLPGIEIIDLRKGIAVQSKIPSRSGEIEAELPSIKGDFFLTSELRAALTQTLDADKQAILFLNRRGLGSQEFCRACGHIPQCPNCDVNLTPHASGLLCHYCAFEIPVAKACKHCGCSEQPFLRIGIGTEAVEEAMKFHFPKARLLRLDRDTTTTQEDYKETLGRFNRKEADVLIGTQMVAKGHDFPDVTLVGILLGELGLAVPDYRANERCLQLLLQVSGRAGRGLHPGRVLLQTFQPDHEVFVALKEQRTLEDYGSFLNAELEKRRVLHYPPYGRLILLRFDGLEEERVEEAARSVGTALKKIRADGLQILGPVVSPMRKLRNRYRWQILLKAEHFETCRKAVNWILEGWENQDLERKYKARLVVDMDPMNML